MATERVVVREMAWRELCPWLILFRTFGLAISLPILFLATLGTLLTPLGWIGSEAWLMPGHDREDAAFRRVAMADNTRWAHELRDEWAPLSMFPQSIGEIVHTDPSIIEPIYRRFVWPLASVFRGEVRGARLGVLLLGTLWMLLVWGFFGGAITRMAVVKLGREEQIGLGEALRHAAGRWLSYISSPLFPLVGVVLIALPLVLIGLLMRTSGGVLLAGVFWFLFLLGGLSITILLLGLMFGWPLMWGVISSEEQGDAFDAFSRSYSYTFQRPLHYLFYAFLATFFGALAWLLVFHFSEAVLSFSRLPAQLVVGSERWSELSSAIANPGFRWEPVCFGASLIAVWEGLVRTIAAAFGYSFFFCLAAAIYLLLRRDVDQTEFDEVYVEREDRQYRLPDLTLPGSEQLPSDGTAD